MAGQPRRHHYVPQFYLAGFTDDCSSEGNLSVLDTVRLKEWKCKPKDAALQHDYHKIDGDPSGDPMIVEKLLGQFESKWSTSLRYVIENHQIPDGDRFEDLMMFIAFLAVRVPRIRNKIVEFIEEAKKLEGFARKWLGQKGQFVQSVTEACDEDFDQSWHVQNMIQRAAPIHQSLRLRSWQLWIAEPAAPDFICSDSPVSLAWTNPPSSLYPPGYSSADTVVRVPLQKRLAMVGLFGSDNSHCNVGRTNVALINSETKVYADQIYFPGSDFVWFMANGDVGGRDDLLTFLRNCQE